ncbi:MAG: hypothetical protein E7171_05245 [Firmicutes bacterium]|nr:hypothetical protein [Bacillota bacterium]
MKNGDIFKKTMPFVWGRFGMQLALNLGVIIYFAIVVWLLMLLIETQAVIAIIVGFVALGIGIKLYSFGCEYIGYMIKAAHVAVIGELALNGQLPQGVNMKEYGKQKVKERFLTANVFFAIDKLMSAAVRQIQNGISKIGGMFEKVEIVQTIISIVNVFVGIVLGYVDEAVLARVFQKKEDGAWKASCDGVVLYFQNWKAILKNALGITFGIVLFYAVGMGALYGLLALISGGAGDGWAILFLIIAFFLIDVIKVAFVDSYVTISVVNKYLPLTMNQEPALDIYEKGQKWSKKFKDMCTKAKEEPQPVVQAAVAGVPGMTMAMPTGGVAQPAQPQVVMPNPGMPQQPMAQPQMATQPQVMQQPVMGQPMAQPQMMPQQPVMQPTQPVAQPQMMQQQPVMQPTQPVAQPQMMQQPVMGSQPVQQPMPGQFPNNNGQM